MADERFLVVRLSSLGDIVHALPAVRALRESFPGVVIDCVVERRWRALVDACPAVSNVIPLERGSWRAIRRCARELRAARYTCSIDFQGLYKSAALAAFSAAPVRIGFDRRFAREAGAAMFYTRRVGPQARHVVEQNCALAEAAGARAAAARFELRVPADAEREVDGILAQRGLKEFVVFSPGGGWRSKCWPPERYAALHRELARRYSLIAVVNSGPGEAELAQAVRDSAGDPAPLCLSPELPTLMALLRRARCVVAGDSGPLHLAVAVGTPVVGLYGPTDPARNGPYSQSDIVVRNAAAAETSYRRGDDYSAAMLSITVEQVVAAVERRLGLG